MTDLGEMRSLRAKRSGIVGLGGGVLFVFEMRNETRVAFSWVIGVDFFNSCKRCAPRLSVYLCQMKMPSDRCRYAEMPYLTLVAF